MPDRFARGEHRQNAQVLPGFRILENIYRARRWRKSRRASHPLPARKAAARRTFRYGGPWSL